MKKTKQWYINRGYEVYTYLNDDYKWKDKEDVYHLMRNDEEIAVGVYVCSCLNGDYAWEDTKGIRHKRNKKGKVIK